MRALEERSILVTGATSGIGRAIALGCVREGARVVASGRNEQALAELAGKGLLPERADLLEVGAADALVDAALARLGRLDGLVHAAGTVRRQEDIRAISDGALAGILESNLTASYRLARAALRAMTADGAGGGSLVFLGSQLARIALPGYASYCAAKGGVESLVRALAVDFGPLGVRVNALAPGTVHTPMAYVDRPDFDEQVEGIAARHPLRRVGRPEDLVGPAVFLLSDASAWVTGHSLAVDGGFTIQ